MWFIVAFLALLYANSAIKKTLLSCFALNLPKLGDKLLLYYFVSWSDYLFKNKIWCKVFILNPKSSMGTSKVSTLILYLYHL